MSGTANEAGKLFAFQLAVPARTRARGDKLGCVLWVLWEWVICVRQILCVCGCCKPALL